MGDDEEMYLKKYPVTTENNTYKVSVFDSYVCMGLYQLKAKVYIETDRIVTFGILKNKKLKAVDVFETGWNNYVEWNGKYVEFATKAVREYEEWLEQELQKEKVKQQGIQEFENWNGVIH